MNPMFDLMFANYATNCERWSRIYAELLRKPWGWLTAPYEFGVNAWTAFLPQAKPASPASLSGTETCKPQAKALEKAARERLEKGYAPPRGIYDVQNRQRIDWSTVPEWARPVDPELFTDCAHEG
jgi:hypothetical protein